MAQCQIQPFHLRVGCTVCTVLLFVLMEFSCQMLYREVLVRFFDHTMLGWASSPLSSCCFCGTPTLYMSYIYHNLNTLRRSVPHHHNTNLWYGGFRSKLTISTRLSPSLRKVAFPVRFPAIYWLGPHERRENRTNCISKLPFPCRWSGRKLPQRTSRTRCGKRAKPWRPRSNASPSLNERVS